MNYTATFSYQHATKDGMHLIKKEYVYDDVPYTIDKIYKNLIDRLRGVTDHFLYPANDKQVIDINSRVMIKLKEYTPNIAASSGYLQITLKNVDPNKVSTIFRIPRNEFELYTLVSLVQNLISATALSQNINLLNNTYKIYYDSHDYNKFSVFIKGVVFDIVKEEKGYQCTSRIADTLIAVKFDDLPDYLLVANRLYQQLLNDGIVCDTLLNMFPSVVFEITHGKSCTYYTLIASDNKLIEITYVGIYNVNIKLFGSFSYTTTLDKCNEILGSMLDNLLSDIELVRKAVKLK